MLEYIYIYIYSLFVNACLISSLYLYSALLLLHFVMLIIQIHCRLVELLPILLPMPMSMLARLLLLLLHPKTILLMAKGNLLDGITIRHLPLVTSPTHPMPEIRITPTGVPLTVQELPSSVILIGIATTSLILVGMVFTMETGAVTSMVTNPHFLTVAIMGETCTCSRRGVPG